MGGSKRFEFHGNLAPLFCLPTPPAFVHPAHKFMYCDPVKVSLHSLVFRKVLRASLHWSWTVVFTFVHEGFWRCKSVTSFEDIYVLRRCESVVMCETLWKCHYTVLFAKRSERPCTSLELSCSHACMKGSDAARVSLVLIRGYLCIATLWKCLYVLRRCEKSVTTQFGVSQCAPSVLALVLNCCIHIRAWRVLTLQECHQFWSNLCIATLWKCRYVWNAVKVSLYSLVHKALRVSLH